MTERIRKGLTAQEAQQRLKEYGPNVPVPVIKTNFLKKILGVATEPMFLLLLIAAAVYFVLGEPRDGAIMLVFVAATIGIDAAQEWRTDKTLAALRDLSAPHTTVIRDGVETSVPSAELVPGDLMLVYEGMKLPADGAVLSMNDLCADESTLTGEAEGVWKQTADPAQPLPGPWRKDYCYAGTQVVQGSGVIEIEHTGERTEYGRIGKAISGAADEKTPLQKQTGKLVRTCAVIALVLCVLVIGVTWFNTTGHAFADRLIESILSGITLAMAMIPEEFPVILTVFLSMGAWRLARKHSLVRRLPSVETLGQISVLCVDKTGTVTMNKMTVTAAEAGDMPALVTAAGLACETDAYDPMEHAILEWCEQNGESRATLFSGMLNGEYPFTNEQKMMGHIWARGGKTVVAAKGSPERILPLCGLSPAALETALQSAGAMAERGLRVLAVGVQEIPEGGTAPACLTDCRLTYTGLIGLSDPPRDGIRADIERCRRAGVRVVMITGDNGVTAAAIARQVGMEATDGRLTGEQIERMTEDELREAVRHTGIFSRVIPAHKMRIVDAFKKNGETVAMTGDGVNDAPALKHADIGVAMGMRGSEVSREAADLILMDDNFSTIVDTISDGRRIYDNIRKAVGYVFAIHIPIALSSLLGPLLGVAPAALLLLPLHVMLLELVIDPTCSIVLERQPAERDIMERKPRGQQEKLLNARILIKSFLQGLTIFLAAFGGYYLTLRTTGDAAAARSLGLCVLMLASPFLVQVNSAETDPVWQTFRALVHDRVMWTVTLGTPALLCVLLYTPLHTYLKLAPLPLWQFALALGLSAAAVLWYEIVKAVKRARMSRARA